MKAVVLALLVLCCAACKEEAPRTAKYQVWCAKCVVNGTETVHDHWEREELVEVGAMLSLTALNDTTPSSATIYIEVDGEIQASDFASGLGTAASASCSVKALK